MALKKIPDWLLTEEEKNPGSTSTQSSNNSWLSEPIDPNKYKTPAPAPITKVTPTFIDAPKSTSSSFIGPVQTISKPNDKSFIGPVKKEPSFWEKITTPNKGFENWDNSYVAKSLKYGLVDLTKNLTNLPRLHEKFMQQNASEVIKKQGFTPVDQPVYDKITGARIKRPEEYQGTIDILQSRMNEQESRKEVLLKQIADKNLSNIENVFSQAFMAIPQVLFAVGATAIGGALGLGVAGGAVGGAEVASTVGTLTTTANVLAKLGKVANVVVDMKKMLPFATTAFSSYQMEAEKEAPNSTLNQQMLYGLAGAGAEVATEYILMPTFMKKWLKIKSTPDLIERGMNLSANKYGSMAYNFLKDMGKEAIQEASADPLTALAKKGIYAPDTKVIDVNQMSQDALTGGAMSAIMGAFGLPSIYKSHIRAEKMLKAYTEENIMPPAEEVQNIIEEFASDLEEADKKGDIDNVLQESEQIRADQTSELIQSMQDDGVDFSAEIERILKSQETNINDTADTEIINPGEEPAPAQSNADISLNNINPLADNKKTSFWQQIKSDTGYAPTIKNPTNILNPITPRPILNANPIIESPAPIEELQPTTQDTTQATMQDTRTVIPPEMEQETPQDAPQDAQREEIKPDEPKEYFNEQKSNKTIFKTGDYNKINEMKLRDTVMIDGNPYDVIGLPNPAIRGSDNFHLAEIGTGRVKSFMPNDLKKQLGEVKEPILPPPPPPQSENVSKPMETTTRGKVGEASFKKWANNEYVNVDLNDKENTRTKAFTDFYNWWYQVGKEGRRVSLGEQPDFGEHFAPFLEDVALNAGKKDASTPSKLEPIKDKKNTSKTVKVEKPLEEKNKDLDVNVEVKTDDNKKVQVKKIEPIVKENTVTDTVTKPKKIEKQKVVTDYKNFSKSEITEAIRRYSNYVTNAMKDEKSFVEYLESTKDFINSQSKKDHSQDSLNNFKFWAKQKDSFFNALVKDGLLEIVNHDIKVYNHFLDFQNKATETIKKDPNLDEVPPITEQPTEKIAKNSNDDESIQARAMVRKEIIADILEMKTLNGLVKNHGMNEASDIIKGYIEKSMGDKIVKYIGNENIDWNILQKDNYIEGMVDRIYRKVSENIKSTEGVKQDANNEISTNTTGTNDQKTLAELPTEDVPAVATERNTGREDIPTPAEVEPGSSTDGRPGNEPGPSEGNDTRPDILTPREAVVENVRISNPKGIDYIITTQEDVISENGKKTRYNFNVDAIKTMMQIEKENRIATPEEQKTLSKYVGWGGIADAFTKESVRNPETKIYEYKGKQGWESEYKELKALLTDDEYRSANDTILNAHYTSIPIIKGMYEGLEHLGFKGGNVLEPAVGIGNFIGSMSSEMRSTVNTFTGIEIDSITGRIAKLLYPNADIRIQGFETAKLPKNYYDVSISNVPFGKILINDSKYPKHLTQSIHNYFFAKAIDTVRPGGVVMFITSSKTMDSQDTSGIREYLKRKADLIGAIRLPESAFKENASTEVITDILILKVREANTPYSGESFSNMKSTFLESERYGGRDVDVNEYFNNNPQNVLGNSVYDRDQYGNFGLVVKDSGIDLNAGIVKAIKSMKGNVITSTKKDSVKIQTLADYAERKQASTKTKEGSYEIVDGKVYVNKEGNLTLAIMDKASQNIIIGMINIKESARKLLNMESNNGAEKDIIKARKELNKLYDKFFKENGAINKPKNLETMVYDPDVYFLMALENYDKKTKIATKNKDVFVTGVKPLQRITYTENSKEAMIVSLNEVGRVDIERIKELTKKSEGEVFKELEGLIFKNPATNNYEPADQYLSGNVKAKLIEAEEMASVNPIYQGNVESLKEVQPKDKEPHEISLKLGSSLIADEMYVDFVKELLGPQSSIQVTQNNITGEFNVYEPKNANRKVKGDTANIATWGIGKRGFSGIEIMEKLMNNKSIMVFDTYYQGDKKYKVLDVESTAIAQEKAEKMKQLFNDWIATHKEGATLTDIAKYYNDVYNTNILRKFDGSHLTFAGMNSNIKLDPHQKDAVWRVISSGGNTLLGHEVGAGKTFEMIAAAMEMRRLGIAKKPLFVVPKAVVDQWGTEFRRLYPGAKLLLPTAKDFSKINRKVMINKIATGDFDGIIITEEQFGMIPMSEQTIKTFFNQMLDEVQQSLLIAKAEAKARGEKDTTTEKQLAGKLKNLRTRMEKKIAIARKDAENVNFEGLGVDSLFVDEAHKFKNLMYTTKLQVSGLGSPDGSDKAFDLLMKVRHLQTLNGGKGIVFATATPVLNSISEVYNWQQYLAPQELQARGIFSFDKWVSVFGKIEDVVEVKPDGNGYRVRKGFARLTNVGQLVQMFRGFADIKTQDDLHLKRPDIKTGQYIIKTVPATPWLVEYMKEIGQRAIAINEGRVEPEEDNMLKITSDGRKSALDPRLVDKSYKSKPGDPPTKIDISVDHLFEQWEKTKKERLTHLVFLEMSVPKTKKSTDIEEDVDPDNPDAEPVDSEMESLYQDIKDRLIAKGIPANEIAFIHDAKTPTQRLALQTKFNDGDIRILIGNNQKMGVGINLQKRTKTITHIDFPWRPKDLQQEDGRGLRQGNMNKEIELYAIVTEGSFDSRLWDNLQRKSRFIDDLMSADTSLTEVEDVGLQTLSFQEIVGLASGNPLMKEQVELTQKIIKLQSLEKGYAKQKYQYAKSISSSKSDIAYAEKYIDALTADLKQLKDTTGKNFTVKIDGKVFNDRKEANDFVLSLIAPSFGLTKTENPKDLFIDFDFAGVINKLMVNFIHKSVDLTFESDNKRYRTTMYSNEFDVIRSIEYKIASIPEDIAKAHEDIKESKHTISGLEKESEHNFDRGDELASLIVRQNEIMNELNPPQTQNSGSEDAEADDGASEADKKIQNKIARNELKEEISEEISGIDEIKKLKDASTNPIIKNILDQQISQMQSNLEALNSEMDSKIKELGDLGADTEAETKKDEIQALGDMIDRVNASLSILTPALVESEDGTVKKTDQRRWIANSNINSKITPDEMKDFYRDNPTLYKYDIENNNQNLEDANVFVQKDINKAIKYIRVKANLDSAYDSAVAMGVAKKLIIDGDFNRAQAWQLEVARKTTKLGQAIQILSVWKKYTAEWVIKKAQKDIEQSLTEVEKDKIESKSDELSKDLNKVNTDSVHDFMQDFFREKSTSDIIQEAYSDPATIQSVSETPSIEFPTVPGTTGSPEVNQTSQVEQMVEGNKTPRLEPIKPKKGKTVDEGINAKINDEDASIGAIMLSNKIERNMGPKEQRERDVLNEMVNTLYEIGKPAMPILEREATNPIEFIKMAMENKETYKETWDIAKEMMQERYADQPEVLSLLDDFFSSYTEKPFSQRQLNKAVAQEMREKKININDLILKNDFHVEGAIDKFAEELIGRGLTAESAHTLAGYIQDRFRNVVERSRQKKIEAIGRLAPIKKVAKTPAQVITELSNLGAFKERNRLTTQAKLDRTINQGIKYADIDLDKLVRSHYSNYDKAEQSLLTKLTDAGINSQDAEYLTSYISKKFGEITSAKKKAILERMFKERTTTRTKKEYYQKILELSNLGIFSKDIYRSYVAKAMGINVLTNEVAMLLTGYANRIQTLNPGRERDIAIGLMMDKIAEQIPPSLLQKIGTIQTIAQLLNTKTTIRNLVSNFAFTGLDTLSQMASVPLDVLISKGALGIKGTNQRKIGMPMPRVFWSGFQEGLKIGIDDARKGISTTGGIGTSYDLPKRTFRSGPLSFLEKGLNMGMSAVDYAVKKGVYKESLAIQMKLSKTTEATQEMIEYATNLAQYRTFNDTNMLSSTFMGLKKLMNSPTYFVSKGAKGKQNAWGMGDLVIKYPKTPANLIMRGIEYSPLGVVKVIGNIANPIMGKEKFNQADFSMNLTRVLMGTTSLVGVGIFLHALGILIGAPEDDKDLRAMQGMNGLGAYRINISRLKRLISSGFNPKASKLEKGDLLYSYDWFQPFSFGVAMGASFDKEKGVSKKLGVIAGIKAGVEAGLDTVENQPLVQGLQRFMQTRKASEGVISLLQGIPSSFTPTALNQIKQFVDNQGYQVYNPKWEVEALNLAIAKVPGLSKKLLQKKINTFGENAEVYQGGSNNLLNVFFNPGFLTKYNPKPESKMVLDVFDETGVKTHIPRVVEPKIQFQNKSYKLDPIQYTAYQRSVGQKVKKAFSNYTNQKTTDKLAKTLTSQLNDANESAKIEILKSMGISTAKPIKPSLNPFKASTTNSPFKAKSGANPFK